MTYPLGRACTSHRTAASQSGGATESKKRAPFELTSRQFSRAATSVIREHGTTKESSSYCSIDSAGSHTCTNSKGFSIRSWPRSAARRDHPGTLANRYHRVALLQSHQSLMKNVIPFEGQFLSPLVFRRYPLGGARKSLSQLQNSRLQSIAGHGIVSNRQAHAWLRFLRPKTHCSSPKRRDAIGGYHLLISKPNGSHCRWNDEETVKSGVISFAAVRVNSIAHL
jgi:hypothetical protein